MLQLKAMGNEERVHQVKKKAKAGKKKLTNKQTAQDKAGAQRDLYMEAKLHNATGNVHFIDTPTFISCN